MRTLCVLGLVLPVVASSLVVACGSNSSPQPGFGCATSGLDTFATCASGTTVNGVDVSHYDGTIDWTQAHGAGIDFAFAKATESTNFIDPTFSTNWAGMKAAGVVRGAYLFFRANVDPTQMANYYLQEMSSVGGFQPGDLPPVVDFETTDGQSNATVAANLMTTLQVLKSGTGMTPIVYTSPGFANPILPAGGGYGSYTLWVANWQVSCPTVPDAWTAWAFWQNADNGTVAGISATVDTDVFNGSLSQLQGFGGPTSDAGTGSSSGGSSGGGSGSGSGSGTDAGTGSGTGTGTDAGTGTVTDSGTGSGSGSGGGGGAGTGTPSAGGTDGGLSGGSSAGSSPCAH